MIYTLVGNHEDILKRREKILADLHKKRPGAPVSFFDKDNFSENTLPELVGLQGLFEEKGIVVLDGLLSGTGAGSSVGAGSADILYKYIDSMADSQNMFIISEKNLNKEPKELLEKKSFKVEYLGGSSDSGSGKVGFSGRAFPERDNRVFSLAEKYLSGDNIGAWSIFRALISDGVEPEQIHGILLWQVKHAFLVGSAHMAGASDKDAGINPFVFKKTLSLSAKSDMAKSFTGPNPGIFWLHKLSDLVNMYHMSRRGKYELADALEVEILNFC